MVQHILPQGLHRLRYDGLHATCKHQRVRLLLKTIWVAMGRAIKGTYRVVARKTYRERVLASTGHDPLRCGRRHSDHPGEVAHAEARRCARQGLEHVQRA